MLIIQDYILLIFNCHKYRFKAEKQKDSWLPKIPSNLLYFHVLGDPNLETDYKFLTEDNILLVKVEDDYNSLPKKVIRAYQATFNTYEFKYIFKTDDDQQVTNNTQALNTTEKKCALVTLRYQNGLVSSLSPLQCAIEVDQLAVQTNQNKLEKLLALVSLYQDLGGGYLGD
jgi:hypothetical protein